MGGKTEEMDNKGKKGETTLSLFVAQNLFLAVLRAFRVGSNSLLRNKFGIRTLF
jgi:hypothetical protein